MLKFKNIFIFMSIFVLIGCDNPNKIKKIVYTSDIHVSLPEGRYYFMTKRYEDFLKNYMHQDNIYFINGDFMDKVYMKEGKVVGGNREYQTKETKYFLDITKSLTSLNKNKVLLNFGAGHDFGDILLSEHLTKQKRIGQYVWGDVDLIWFTSKQAAFPSDNILKSHSLTNSEYKLLEDMLAKSNNAILFSHIPLRTDETFIYGKWANNKNLTIPLSDPLYKIIDKYQNSILAIFTGHIHISYKSQYNNIPIFAFPLISNNAHCEIEQNDKSIKIIPKNSNLENQIIYLKKEFLELK